jgi:phosphoenolpyruvate carboxylase
MKNIIDETLKDDHRVLYDDPNQRPSQTRSLLLRDLLSEKMDSTTKIQQWLSEVTPIAEMVEPMLRDSNDLDLEERTATAAHSSCQPISPTL